MTQAVIQTTVTGMQGRPLSTTAPAANQAYTWSGSAWTPTGPFLPLAGGILTGALRYQYAGPTGPIINDTATSITAGGLFRIAVSGGQLNIQSNTATAGDFSTATTPLQLSNTGSIATGPLTVNGNASVTGTAAVGGSLQSGGPIFSTGARVYASGGNNIQPSICAVSTTGGTASFGLYIDINGVANLGQVNTTGAPAGSWLIFGPSNCYPPVDNSRGWGIPGAAWFQVASYNFPQQSDPRSKKDITTAPADPLAQVLAIPVHNYRFLNDAETAPLHWGFLSTEVHTTMGNNFAGWVQGEDENQTEALNIMDMLAVLWGAVQELAQKANVT